MHSSFNKASSHKSATPFETMGAIFIQTTTLRLSREFLYNKIKAVKTILYLGLLLNKYMLAVLVTKVTEAVIFFTIITILLSKCI